VDIVPKPEMDVLGIVVDALGADAPLPYTYPVSAVVVGAPPEPPPRTKPF